MIGFKVKGDFSNATRYLERLRKNNILSILDNYGKEGVAALSSATPIDSGLTASSWSYEVVKEPSCYKLVFHNSNINDGVPIAVILQYGHGTGTGGWVEGRDYINPATQPIFDRIVEQLVGEVTRL